MLPVVRDPAERLLPRQPLSTSPVKRRAKDQPASTAGDKRRSQSPGQRGSPVRRSGADDGSPTRRSRSISPLRRAYAVQPQTQRQGEDEAERKERRRRRRRRKRGQPKGLARSDEGPRRQALESDDVGAGRQEGSGARRAAKSEGLATSEGSALQSSASSKARGPSPVRPEPVRDKAVLRRQQVPTASPGQIRQKDVSPYRPGGARRIAGNMVDTLPPLVPPSGETAAGSEPPVMPRCAPSKEWAVRAPPLLHAVDPSTSMRPSALAHVAEDDEDELGTSQRTASRALPPSNADGGTDGVGSRGGGGGSSTSSSTVRLKGSGGSLGNADGMLHDVEPEALGFQFAHGAEPADGTSAWDITIRFDILQAAAGRQNFVRAPSRLIDASVGPVHLLSTDHSYQLELDIVASSLGCAPVTCDAVETGPWVHHDEYPTDLKQRKLVFNRLMAHKVAALRVVSCEAHAPNQRLVARADMVAPAGFRRFVSTHGELMLIPLRFRVAFDSFASGVTMRALLAVHVIPAGVLPALPDVRPKPKDSPSVQRTASRVPATQPLSVGFAKRLKVAPLCSPQGMYRAIAKPRNE